MASSVIGALRVNLGLDTAQFSKGAKRGQSEIQKFGARVAKLGAVMSVASTGMALAIKGQLNYADAMSKASQKFGVPIEQLSAYGHAAEMAGVSQESLGTGLRKLAQNMNDAFNGKKASAEVFERLGIAVTDASGAMRSSEDVLKDAADALASMEDGAEKTALAVKLFGRAGADLIPMLNGGSEGLQKMVEEARSLGIVIDEKTGKAAENFNDNLTRLRKTFGGMVTQIMAQLAPALERLSAWAVEATSAFRNLSPMTQKFLSWGAAAVVVIGPLLAGLGLLILSLGAIGTVIAAALSPLSLLILGVAGVAAGAAFIYSKWEPIKGWFAKLWENLSGSFRTNWDAIKAAADEWSPDWLKAFFQSSVDGATLPLNGLEATVKLAFEGIKRWMIDPVQATKDAWSGIGTFFSGIMVDVKENIAFGWNQVTALFEGWKADFIDVGKQLVEGLRQGITARWDAMLEWAGDKFEALKKSFRDRLGIKSPSRVFREYGEFITQGLAEGLDAGADGAVEAMARVAEAVKGKGNSLQSGLLEMRSTFESAFVGLVTGAMKFKDALRQVLGTLAQMAAKRAFSAIFERFLPGPKVPGFATGTPYAAGGLAMVGERGAELVDLPRGSRVYNASQTRDIMGGGGGGGLSGVLQVRLADGLVAEMLQQAGQQSIQIVQANNRQLPDLMASINANPRRR
jgi:phage-related protein